MGDAVMYLGCLLPTVDPKSTENCKQGQIYTKTEVWRFIVEATAGFPYLPSHCNIQLYVTKNS